MITFCRGLFLGRGGTRVDFRVREQVLSDHIAKQILEDWGVADDEKPDRKTNKQREQRWRMDGEFAERIKNGLRITDPDDASKAEQRE